MKEQLRANLAIGGLLIAAFCAPARAGDVLATATVNITVTVLPFAEVSVDSGTVQVTLPDAGGSSDSVYVGGTVTCNCSVMLFADVEPPEEAVGQWYATLMVPEAQPGVHVGDLVRINVLNIPPGHGADINLGVLGSKLGENPIPQAGQVVITVMQM